MASRPRSSSTGDGTLRFIGLASVVLFHRVHLRAKRSRLPPPSLECGMLSFDPLVVPAAHLDLPIRRPPSSSARDVGLARSCRASLRNHVRVNEARNVAPEILAKCASARKQRGLGATEFGERCPLPAQGHLPERSRFSVCRTRGSSTRGGTLRFTVPAPAVDKASGTPCASLRSCVGGSSNKEDRPSRPAFRGLSIVRGVAWEPRLAVIAAGHCRSITCDPKPVQNVTLQPRLERISGR